ncbi:MAG: ABC transporter permease subunit [Candidatus Bipolaricaulia bacterium]
MLRNVLLKTLQDRRRALLWWGIGLVGLALYTTLFYPTIRDNPEFSDIFEQAPEFMKAIVGDISDLTSPEGYLNAELFSLMMPLLFMIFTIGMGSGAIAGEEERGTLDLLLSNPLPRSKVALEKFVAMIGATLVLAFIFWLGLVVGTIAAEMEIGLGRLVEMTLSSVLLGLAFGTLALTLGCITGKRGLSIGVASTLGVATYFLNSLATLVETLEPFRKLSPFYYYSSAEPLKNGLNPGHVAVLIGLTVVLLAVALIAFERRDLAV